MIVPGLLSAASGRWAARKSDRLATQLEREGGGIVPVLMRMMMITTKMNEKEKAPVVQIMVRDISILASLN
jgi:hypothetical protein